ncbi:MAG TPA: C40 family peptidase [Streptosporangiaceae bacterium]|nr:C40 family peptidase [Streptosporangiaceae bacterium]
MRDRTRFLVPAATAISALLIATVIGPSSAARPVAAGHPRPVKPAATHHSAAGLGRNLISAAPAPGLDAVQSGKFAVPVALLASRRSTVAPLGTLRPADLLVVAPRSLPRSTAAAIARLGGVTGVQSVDAARIQVNGKLVAMLGVNPSTFRSFAARPVAESDRLWQSVADGSLAVSYSMGKLDRLPLGGTVTVAGVKQEKLRIGSFATVGITGVDAVVSDAVARSLGFPAGNAILVSAPHDRFGVLMKRIARLIPKSDVVEPLVSQIDASGTSGAAGISSGLSAREMRGYPTLTSAQLSTILNAALSRRGMPYVWGGSGPKVFDCSGLVQWSFAQAGIVMPRVAADQALTGPAVPLSEAAPGDLLFYHTDPTDPHYISHVAIYLGHGLMIQAPEPGLDVEVVPVALGPELAGVVRVDPQIAASVAASV